MSRDKKCGQNSTLYSTGNNGKKEGKGAKISSFGAVQFQKKRKKYAACMTRLLLSKQNWEGKTKQKNVGGVLLPFKSLKICPELVGLSFFLTHLNPPLYSMSDGLTHFTTFVSQPTEMCLVYTLSN